jgi:hypothetical protein
MLTDDNPSPVHLEPLRFHSVSLARGVPPAHQPGPGWKFDLPQLTSTSLQSPAFGLSGCHMRENVRRKLSGGDSPWLSSMLRNARGSLHASASCNAGHGRGRPIARAVAIFDWVRTFDRASSLRCYPHFVGSEFLQSARLTGHVLAVCTSGQYWVGR